MIYPISQQYNIPKVIKRSDKISKIGNLECGDSMIPFGKLLRELRNNRNWSQAQLGSRLGISASQIAHYETGDRLPSLPVVVNTSRVFGVTTDYLLGVNEKKEDWLDVAGLTPEEIDLIDKIVESYRKLHKKAVIQE